MPNQRRSASSFAAELMYERGRAPSLDSSGEIRGYRSVPGSTPSPMNSRGVGIGPMQKNANGLTTDAEWNRVFPRSPSLAPATPPNAAAMAGDYKVTTTESNPEIPGLDASSNRSPMGSYVEPGTPSNGRENMPFSPEVAVQRATSDSAKWLQKAGLSVPMAPASKLPDMTPMPQFTRPYSGQRVQPSVAKGESNPTRIAAGLAENKALFAPGGMDYLRAKPTTTRIAAPAEAMTPRQILVKYRTPPTSQDRFKRTARNG